MNNNFWQKRKQIRMEEYWSNHPHRQFIIDELKKLEFNSLLEVGCACGYNLKLIKEEFDVDVAGIDINEHAVEFGRSKGLNLMVGDVKNLDNPINTFDIVLSDACLLYIHPKDIKRVILNFTRIAKKALVFCEFYDRSKLGRQCFGQWGRDYSKLLLEFGFKTIKIKIPKEVWSEPNWKERGYLFVTKLNN